MSLVGGLASGASEGPQAAKGAGPEAHTPAPCPNPPIPHESI